MGYLQHFVPKYPLGQTVQMFSSIKSQAEHAALQATRVVILYLSYADIYMSVLSIPVSQLSPEDPSGHSVHLLTAEMSQSAHTSLQHFAPEYPSGHAVQMLTSELSQAAHASLHATTGVILVIY